MAETLAVEAHQVDCRQVGLALDAALCERTYCRVAVDPVRQLDDEHEPPPLLSGGVLARECEALDLRERLAVQVRHTRTARERLAEPSQLHDAERARELVEAVVEAEPIVVQPAHVRRATLVALGVDPLLKRLVADADHPALARRQLFVRIETEHRGMAASSDRDAIGRNRTQPRRRAATADAGTLQEGRR